MFLERRKDGGLLFNERWDRFSQEWHRADHKQRVVLDDGRPAIRREPSPDGEDGEITFTTLAPELWNRIKSRQREAFLINPPPPRTRLCQACRAEMAVTKEYENVWCFKCSVCGSSETWGKDIVGGTRGAGETEKR